MARKTAPSTPSKLPSKTSTSTTSTPKLPTQQPTIPSKFSSSTSQTSSTTLPPLSATASPLQVATHVWSQYIRDTPPRTLWLDAFMAYLVVLGGLQFLYAVLGGNYPFNAFLSAFAAAVGQFVLLASLRLQTTESLPRHASAEAVREAKRAVDGVTGDTVVQGPDVGVGEGEEGVGQGKGKGKGKGAGGTRVSSERAFADFVFGSLILHGFCVNFIN